MQSRKKHGRVALIVGAILLLALAGMIALIAVWPH